MKSKYNRNRISQEAMVNSIYTTHGKTSPVSKSDNTTTIYTISGHQDEKDSDGFPIIWDLEDSSGNIWSAGDRKEAYAKKIVGEINTLYYIRVGNDGHFFNPLKLHSETQHNKSKLGLKEQEFLRVAPKSFNMYLNFLKTKNQSWLVNAERENM